MFKNSGSIFLDVNSTSLKKKIEFFKQVVMSSISNFFIEKIQLKKENTYGSQINLQKFIFFK